MILNFNAGDRVLKCVSSTLVIDRVRQILVIDNGSTDGSLEALHALAARQPTMRIIENGANFGFSKGNNRALRFLLGPYTLFLNPDTAITQEMTVHMLDYLESHPDVGMCGPLILNEDGSEQRGCRRDEPTPLASLKTLIGNRERGINKVGAPLPDGPVEVDAISGACMLVRRDALEDVGPLDEGYFLHCEDLDWCKRFWLKGWKVMFLPQVSITHVKGGSSERRRVRVEWHKHKGMIRYYRKFYRDKYPTVVMYVVYAAVWTRFALLLPVWRVKSMLK